MKKDLEGYYVENASDSMNDGEINSEEKLWKVIQSTPEMNGNKIEKFDTIKIGKAQFKVKDFHCAYDCCTEEEMYAQEIKEAREV